MATTEINAITTTPNKALNYTLADKIVEIDSEKDINKEIPNTVFEKNGKKYVHYYTITGFQNCSIQTPYDAFRDRQEKWQGVKYKNGGSKTKSGNEPVMYHLHQSFEGFEVSYETANEIGRKLGEEVFPGYVVTVSTHGNTDNIHNHFIISAWDENGRKWNDCHKTKRLIRSVSDRLCEEYGLSVLEHTRDMKLLKYKDENGKLHYYEPTDRKNELIRKRNLGEISRDDVGSYRNVLLYEEEQNKKQNNRVDIKADIDTLLPSCRSYEELIERLRDLGYTVRDKKKNGEWLAHVSFQAPMQNKATREDKLGDGQFYLRENLQKFISEQSEPAKDLQLQNKSKKESNIPYHSEYMYGRTDLNEINDDYKTVLENGEYFIKERTKAEKKVITDIRAKDIKVRGLIDTTQLHKIIEQQNLQRARRKPYLNDTQEQKLVAQIQSSFRCLQYAEQHNIYSYEQIIDLYSACKTKYDAAIDNLTKAEQSIGQLKNILAVPDKLATLRHKVDSHKNDISYILEEYNQDNKAITNYKAITEKYRIYMPQGIQTLEKS
ncbi:relaxase/mobilization nuclease domain-containing protein [bacterium]|nr:relaxase/mobilization nuclease domain-containing protein [bacterium]